MRALGFCFACFTSRLQKYHQRLFTGKNNELFRWKISSWRNCRRVNVFTSRQPLVGMTGEFQSNISPDRNEALLGLLYFSKPEELHDVVQEHLEELDEDFYAFMQFKIDSAVDVEERNSLKLLRGTITEIIQKLGKEALENLVANSPSASQENSAVQDTKNSSQAVVASYDSLIDSLVNRDNLRSAVEAEYENLDGYFMERLETRIKEARDELSDKLVFLRNTVQDLVQDRMKAAATRLENALRCGSPDIIEKKFEEMNERGEIDTAFVLLLSANIEEARKHKAFEAVRVFQKLQNKVAELKDRKTSPEVALVRQLLRTESAEARAEVLTKALTPGPKLYLADGSLSESKAAVDGRKFVKVLKKLKEDFGNLDIDLVRKIDALIIESEKVAMEIFGVTETDIEAMQNDAFQQRLSIWELAEMEERYEKMGKQPPWQMFSGFDEGNKMFYGHRSLCKGNINNKLFRRGWPRSRFKQRVLSQLRIDCSSFSISCSHTSNNACNAHFELPEYNMFGLIDCEGVEASVYHNKPLALLMKFAIRSTLDSFVEQALSSSPESSSLPVEKGTLRDLLKVSLEQLPLAEVVSCCIINIDERNSLLHSARIGNCGFLVVREDKIIYDTRQSCIDILENCYKVSPENGSTCVDDFIKQDEVFMEANDVVLLGNSGFIWSISNEQILAFLRPVSSSFDTTLSLANQTSLGYFYHDDPQMISYMLAHIAFNYLEEKPFMYFSRHEKLNESSFVSPLQSTLFLSHTSDTVTCVSCILRKIC
eukprot:jgi/Galph1/298/GphlegSOOS_G5107.1